MAKRSSDVRKKANTPTTPVLDAGDDASENARLADEVQRLLRENEQRNAELALISSVQQGLAAKLDMQAIYDLVGDKIREIFNADTTFIAFKDAERKVLATVYYADREKKITADRLCGRGLAEIILESGQPLLIKTAEERAKYPVFEVASPGAQKDRNTSILGCPIAINGQIAGVVSVQDYAEYAFDENDQRLLITLANSMSVALENARLFDETQRLLKETEQRNAELAIINSVQEGLSLKLDMQAIYDLVGDKIREIFPNTDTEIRVYDPKTNLIHFPYFIDDGKRVAVDPIPLTDSGISSYVLRTGQTLVINENFMQEAERFGSTPILLDGGHLAKSAVFVPLAVNNQARGVLVLGNVEREHAFSSSDVRLFQTLVNSMSTALENARLFDETQRLLKETEQRNAELAIINSVQEGLASKLDMQAIYDLVGDKIRDLFSAQSVWIVMFDQDTRTRHFKYSFEKGRRPYVSEALPYNKLAEHLIATKRTLVINQDADARIAEFEMASVANTERFKSAIFVPLIADGEVKGFITLQNVEQENAFSESDINLLSTLASSMSVALENARLFDETQRLFQLEQQRAAELAIINSVQSALAENLDIQAIYDIVGDKIQNVFNAQTVILMSYDDTANLRKVHYYVEKGERFYQEPAPLHELHKTLIRNGKTLVFNENTYEELTKLGSTQTPGSEVARSAVFVPLMIGIRVFGVISLQNVDHEHAFSEADVRLLETLASSMSVALENARLFDETQRLLKETEQRNAELAIINSVQEGLASKLDVQAIYDLVGDKIRDIFQAQGAAIYLFNHTAEMLETPYCYLKKRFEIEARPFSDHPIAALMISTIQPLIYHTLEEYRALGGTVLENSEEYKSGMYVPLMVGKELRGMVGIANLDKENAYDDSDLRLLQTLANSMSVALENARLFNETQRLLKETEQRNVELAIINSVQQGLASKLDMQAIYDLVGDKIRDLLNAQSVWIITFDPATRTRRVRYSFENGQRYYTSESFPYNKLTEHLITTKKPLVINQNFTEAIARFEMVNIAGTQEQIKSIVYIPIMAGEDVKGFISLPNRERENAFSESDVNLLSTFAFAMSIALENIRLFDETRRLLKETEQRAAELAIINSVQEGLSSKLDMQAIYELVGDKMQEIFDAQSLLIVTFDHVHELAHLTYNREKGIRYYSEPYPFTGLHRHLIQSRSTVVINENSLEWQAKFGMVLLPGTQQAKSMIFVPLTSGYRVSGLISLQNLEREHAFSDTDVRLLETLASSMSVALENASLFDETQRLFLEAREAHTAAEQANQAKSAFLSSMSHELRTPLNAIINFVEMVARGMIGPVNQEQVELLDQALHSSKHLLNLINDVLDISKIQAGQLTLFVEDQVSVHVEVEAALSIVGGLLQEKGLQLIRDIDPHLPMVSCDRRRLRQVLLNLISNAIKFTNEGTLTVSVKNQGQDVLFAVIDTGPGIPPDKQELIFEPFLQAENGERQVHGTGLGLPISRSLVRAHGGELWVDSERGEGSAFFFTLPVERRSTP